MNPEFVARLEAEALPPLTPPQEQALAALDRDHAAGINAGYLNMATGLGKTRVLAEDAKKFLDTNPGSRVLYLCHNTDILEHAREEFMPILGTESHGRVFGGQFEAQEDIVYATFQTMTRPLGAGKVYQAFKPDEFQLIDVDENHHGPAPTYREVIDYFQPQQLTGATATPERRDQRSVEAIFGKAHFTYLLEDAIANGHLARPDYRLLTDHVRRLDSLDEVRGLTPKQLDEKIFVRRRDAEIADAVAEHLYDRPDSRTIVFAPNIEYAEYIKDFLPGNVATYHSKLAPKLQAVRLERFKRGSIDMLVTINKLNEGVDVPEANVIVFLRSTESRAVFLQQLGRGLRKIPGKEEVLVLDFAASWDRIKMVKDLERTTVERHSRLSTQDRQRHTGDPFKFDFSEEALNVIDVVEYARSARQSKPRKEAIRTHLGQHALAETMLQASLPARLDGARAEKLTKLIKGGDEAARGEFVLGYASQLYALAVKKAEGNLELIEEYFQDGCLKLMEEAGGSSYDTMPSLYRAYHIAHSYMNLRGADYDALKLSANTKNELQQLNKLEAELENKLGRPVTLDELADAAEPIIGRFDELYSLRTTINTSMAWEELPTDLKSGEDLLELANSEVRKTQVHEMLKNLSYRERRILELRFGLGSEAPRTRDEVGRTFNVTRERISQIENQSLKKLQTLEELNSLREFDPVALSVRVLSERELANARKTVSSLPLRVRKEFATRLKVTRWERNSQVLPILSYDKAGLADYAYLLTLAARGVSLVRKGADDDWPEPGVVVSVIMDSTSVGMGASRQLLARRGVQLETVLHNVVSTNYKLLQRHRQFWQQDEAEEPDKVEQPKE